jgi:hypothetical protein
LIESARAFRARATRFAQDLLTLCVKVHLSLLLQTRLCASGLEHT